MPPTHHPIQALLGLIASDPHAKQAEAVVIPGDLTNKASAEGLSTAWSLCREVASALDAPILVPALGNHDVDSRKDANPDPFYIARTIDPSFPFSDRTISSEYFSSGSCVLSLNDRVQLIAINSAIDHHDEPSAKRGKFTEERIAAVYNKLKEARPAPIRIAVLHHHPILHSSPVIGSRDVIDTGDILLDALRKAGCGLVIHGHKHHPRIRYGDTASGRIVVFAAGSLCAMLQRLASTTRNVFHLLEVEQSNGARSLRGMIWTWEWQLGFGWRPATEQSADIPYVAGFGSSTPLSTTRTSLLRLADARPATYVFYPQELSLAAPELAYMIPSEIRQLAADLLRSRGLRLRRDESGALELCRPVSL